MRRFLFITAFALAFKPSQGVAQSTTRISEHVRDKYVYTLPELPDDRQEAIPTYRYSDIGPVYPQSFHFCNSITLRDGVYCLQPSDTWPEDLDAFMIAEPLDQNSSGALTARRLVAEGLGQQFAKVGSRILYQSLLHSQNTICTTFSFEWWDIFPDSVGMMTTLIRAPSESIWSFACRHEGRVIAPSWPPVRDDPAPDHLEIWDLFEFDGAKHLLLFATAYNGEYGFFEVWRLDADSARFVTTVFVFAV